jgi:arsenate reductase
MAPDAKPASATRSKVLFICVGNTCRSQMAEALARHLAADVIEPASAGISPFGRIVDTTRRVLLERGVRVDGQWSKGLREVQPEQADLVVNMSGIPGTALFPNARVVDWDVGDPYGEDMSVYREIRDEIEARVTALADELRAARANSASR